MNAATELSPPPALAGSQGGVPSLSEQIHRLRHDLRNPLSDILGFSELLMEEAESGGNHELLADFKKLNQFAANLLGQVSRILNPHTSQSRPEQVVVLHEEITQAAKRIIGLAEEASFKCDQLANTALGDDLLRVSSAARKLEHMAPLVLQIATSASACNGHDLEVSMAASSVAGEVRRDDPRVLKPDHGNLLVVDDNESNRALLTRMLRRQGYTVSLAENGRQALEKLGRQKFDLVLLDIVMPEMDGHAVLRAMKAHESHRHIPVIMISALDDLDSLVSCILGGAEDYLTKPFDPVLLRARVGSSLEKKRLHDREQATYEALQRSQKHLASELAKASSYLRSLLPEPLTGVVETEWCFQPSDQLGGDAFGYHWMDSDHLSMYLLDVCGHGVGAALLSVSVLNTLRSKTLPGTDFLDPGAVLAGLNRAFPMENQNNLYFTLWYGVYCASRRELRYSSGGHPPALLLNNGVAGRAMAIPLATPGAAIGCFDAVHFGSALQPIEPGARLLVLSDGVFEIFLDHNRVQTWQDFYASFNSPTIFNLQPAERLKEALKLRGAEVLEDDFSLMELRF